MNRYLNPLTKFLSNHFFLNNARINCLALFIVSLLKSKHINLVHVSQVCNSKASVNSTYRRLQRFLSEVLFNPKHLSKALASIMGLYQKNKWKLILDRTNWKFGSIDINMLYLSVAHQTTTIFQFARR